MQSRVPRMLTVAGKTLRGTVFQSRYNVAPGGATTDRKVVSQVRVLFEAPKKIRSLWRSDFFVFLSWLCLCHRVQPRAAADIVLPIDFDLYTELVGGRTKKCKRCGKEFFIRSPRQVYCPTCGEQNKRDNAAQRQQRKRDKCHAFGG